MFYQRRWIKLDLNEFQMKTKLFSTINIFYMVFTMFKYYLMQINLESYEKMGYNIWQLGIV